MAQYPSAVATFSAKADGAGNKVQASHINSLQDEITAIEDGLLNGSAPINSSRITAPSLQVTNSTISSLTVGVLTVTAVNNLSVSSGSTLTTLNVTGGSTLATLNVTTPCDAVRATNNAVTDVANNTYTVLSFNTHTFQVGASALHSTATNSSRFYPQSSGLYTVVGNVLWSPGSTGVHQCSILVNSTIVIGQQQNDAANASAFMSQNVSAIYNFNVGDYVELRVYQNSGSTGSLSTNGAYTQAFSIAKLR